MTSLSENLVNRVRQLAKPANGAQAMKPVLGTVSNAMMAIVDRRDSYGEDPIGHVKVEIDGVGGERVEISVSDNGIGLDHDRFKEFCEIDTGFKRTCGGKGVGRLYWLDSFERIEISSQFRSGRGFSQRSFNFRLRRTEQVDSSTLKYQMFGREETGTIVRLLGLEAGPYSLVFPKQPKQVMNYLVAEFIADFLGGSSSRMSVAVSSQSGEAISAEFPIDVVAHVAKGPRIISESASEGMPELKIEGYLCKKEISQYFEGCHQVHLLGNMRTVETRNIDNFLDIGAFTGIDGDNLAMHIVVKSDYLDERVAESRTCFTIPASILDDIVKNAVDQASKLFIAEQ